MTILWNALVESVRQLKVNKSQLPDVDITMFLGSRS
jgi:hypothetical protein